MSRYDVVIVGAGVVGAACADEFTRRGMSVAVVDRDGIGSGATSAAMGHIVVMDNSDAQFALTRYSQQLWQTLRPDLPPAAEFQQPGTLWVAADDEEMSEVRRKREYYEAHGIAAEELNAAALKECEPNLRDGLAGGLRVPGDCVVDPLAAAQFLMDRAQQRGAGLIQGRSVIKLGEGIVQLSDGSEIAGAFLVNAAGVSSADLVPGLEIKARKGHLAITGCHPGFLQHQVVELGYLKSAHSVNADSVAFNVQPRKGGRILIGSSRQYGTRRKEVDAVILEQMLRRAEHYMPALAGMAIERAWTGFRAATADSLPLIGPLPKDKSLFLATGHEGLGITTSLATAQILADQITGTKSEIPVEPYFPARMVNKKNTSAGSQWALSVSDRVHHA